MKNALVRRNSAPFNRAVFHFIHVMIPLARTDWYVGLEYYGDYIYIFNQLFIDMNVVFFAFFE